MVTASSFTATTDPGLSRLLRREEVADLLGVDPRTVRWYTELGRLPAVRLGRRTTRYRHEDVAALIARSTHRVLNDDAPAGNGREVTTSAEAVGHHEP